MGLIDDDTRTWDTGTAEPAVSATHLERVSERTRTRGVREEIIDEIMLDYAGGQHGTPRVADANTDA